ncbi:MAG: hypothetical protein DHS20C16_09200 [Phycisphaerae bacterium]|nr:MAG: hypothetical protein DHS20C16_09200 [Phycisphaerae bacterium]
MHDILIVDNEPFDLSILQVMLEDDNYRFLTASTDEETKRLISDTQPHLAAILIDWILPDSDGVALLAWLKSRPELADVEVIVHSVEFESANVERGIECGAYYYVTKPFEEVQLEAIVRAAISSFELKRRLRGEVKASEDVFAMLSQGRFKFKTVEEASLLAVYLASACRSPSCSMGIRELLVNAVEHGNLEISYDEKGQLLADHTLEAERSRRLGLDKYRDRCVEVTLQRTSTQVSMTIKDSGRGFNFERFLTMDDERLFDAHGRGVLMASSCLELQYIEPGNEVRVNIPIAQT